MTAEDLFAIVILVAAFAFLIGHEAGRRQERYWSQRRVEKVRRMYTGRPW